MALPSASLSRLRTAAAFYGRGLLRLFKDRMVLISAQAVAFKVLVTIVPVLILATGIFALILQQDRPFQALASLIADLLPGAYSGQLIDFLRELQGAGDAFTAIGAVGLLYSAITLFTTLRLVIQGVFREDWHEHRSMVRGYFFDLRMALAVGGLFVLTFGLTLAMSTLSASGLELAQRVGLDYVWLEDGWRRTFKFLGLLVPFLLTTTMFGLLYYSIPKPHPPRRSVLVGAVCAAALWEGAKSGFAWYATNLGRFDRYSGTGGEAGIAAVGDTFGLIIAFVLWIYLSSVLLILGALITLLHETYRRRQMPDPSPSAPDPMSVDSAEMVGPRLPIEAVDAAGPASGMPPAEAEEPMAAPREEEAPPSLKPPLAPPDRPVEQRP